MVRRAGVSAPHQRARTAMERRPYHLGHHIGRVLGLCCRMVDVAEDGAGRGGDEPAENLACGAEALRGESNGRGIRELWRNCVNVFVA